MLARQIEITRVIARMKASQQICFRASTGNFDF
jgi:hypothetical protein